MTHSNTPQPPNAGTGMRLDRFTLKAAEALRDSLGGIAQTAGEAGQSSQCADVEDSVWLDGVAICLEPFFKALVLDCAKQCEGRANGRETSDGGYRHMTVNAEARKCAAQIRHNMLCGDGQSICLRCDGEGCDRCGQAGIKVKNENPV